MRRIFRWVLRLLLALIVLGLLVFGAGWWWFHPGFTVTPGIVYTKRNGHELTLDVVRPVKPGGSAILVMVSGKWKSDPRKFQPWMAASFLREGHTLFAISHLSQPEATVQEIVEDVHRAARFVRHHAKDYGIDPRRIGVFGGSSGGHLSLMLAARGGAGDPKAADPVDRESSAVQAAAVFYPVTDLLNLGPSSENLGDGGPPKSFVNSFGPKASDLSEWKRIGHDISPIFHVSESLPPVFIAHGDADTLVPLEQSTRFQQKAAEFGREVRLTVQPAEKHGWPTMIWDAHLFAGWFTQMLDAAGLPERAVESAHAELWRRFVDEHDLILDYVGLKGEIVRPTPEDCREMKPSALSWGVPNEDGPMFNGLYLDAMCSRWLITKKDADRAKARRMIDGLIKVSTIGKTPGFIARGIATDGKTTYPMGSNDQTTPWLYGIWRYVTDGLANNDAERQDLVQRFIAQVKVLDSHDWKVPTDGPPSPYRGDFAKPTWEAVPRLLFILKAMHAFTGEATWQERYLAAAHEKVGKGQRERLEVCRIGMVFDPGQGERHSWTGSECVICLRGLWEMESDPVLKNAYAEGLRHSAELAAKSLGLIEKFDVNDSETFDVDWRVMNGAWKPQHSEAEAVEVALAGLKLQHAASPRMHIEKDYLREPCFAAWVVTLCPERDFLMSQRAAIEKVITHYDFSRVYLSQFFPVESAWWRLRLLEP